MATDQTIEALKDTAQQVVTSCLHGDRYTAAQLVEDCLFPDVLALVIADLTVHVHRRWSTVTGAGHTAEGWQALMADIEAGRTADGD